MQKHTLIHIPHSSLYIPYDYRETSLIDPKELEKENLFMCDFRVDEFLDDKSQAIIFPYSRLYCDVERFKDDSEVMNKYGMGYIYTKTSDGRLMFSPSLKHRETVSKIYDQHHEKLDSRVTEILDSYGKCVIIDLHSFSSELVLRLFNYTEAPDICIGVEDNYYSEELTNYFMNYFKSNGYSVKINYPYKGSLVPNKFYRKVNPRIVSIMLEINKRVYENDFDTFKNVIQGALNF